MGLDVRLPIGLMFAIIGMLLIAYGMLAPRVEGAGLNVMWGFVMLAAGALLLGLSRSRNRSRT